MTSGLRDLPLVEASVPSSATFAEAAHELCRSGLSAIAVVDGERQVVGLFTEDDLLAGLFPRYLGELHHTSFAADDLSVALGRAAEAAREPVEQHMRAPITIDVNSSTLHAAEVFLHCEWGALAVVERGRMLGMLVQVEFCRRLLPELEL